MFIDVLNIFVLCLKIRNLKLEILYYIFFKDCRSVIWLKDFCFFRIKSNFLFVVLQKLRRNNWLLRKLFFVIYFVYVIFFFFDFSFIIMKFFGYFLFLIGLNDFDKCDKMNK